MRRSIPACRVDEGTVTSDLRKDWRFRSKRSALADRIENRRGAKPVTRLHQYEA